MKTKAICLIGIMMLASISLIGQVSPPVTIDQSYIPDATSKSNGFKIVSPGELYPNMELFAVYMFDSTTIKIAQSTDGGMTWDTISIMNPGPGWTNPRYPSIDYHMFPTVVYQADSGNQTDIFLECPYDYCVPTRISYTSDNSHSPAIVFDDTGAVHVVWEESGTGRSSIIYYEAPNICDYSSSVTETLASWHDVYHRRPSISIFSTGLTVVWEAEDPLSDTPYRIMRAVRSGGGFSVPEIIDSDWHELKNPSLDYAHGSSCEPFSAGWERHDEIFFNPLDSLFRANEYSDLPVIGNVPGYEYYYWEHDSGGFEDIYYDVCYWGAATMRWGHNFSEDFSAISPRCPSATGASVIWTEGDSAPYLVKYVDLGYAINIEELTYSRPASFTLSAYPNPFNSAVTIALDIPVGDGSPVPISVEIYDVNGRLLHVISSEGVQPDEKSSTYPQEISRPACNDTKSEVIWRPDESLPSGVYLVRATAGGHPDGPSTRGVIKSGSGTVATARVVYLK